MNAHVAPAALPADAVGVAAPQAVAPIQAAIPPDIRISQPAIIGSVLAFDSVTLILVALVTWSLAGQSLATPAAAIIVALASAACTVLILQRLWGYTIAALGNVARQVGRLGGAIAMAFAALASASMLLGIDLGQGRDWLIGWALVSFAILATLRVVVAHLVTGWTAQGRLARRAVIVGGGKPSADLIAALEKDGSRAIRILGLFDDRGNDRSPDEIGSYRKLGRFDQLVDFCRDHRVDLLIIALPHTAEARILHLLRKLWILPVDIRISALDSRLKLRPSAYTWIGKVPFLSVFDKPMSDWGQTVKTAEDRIIAGLALLALSPVMALVALAVKLDSKGPIFFRQTRYGFNNEKIGVFKFRSMYVDQSDASASKLVTKGDPRVTRVGAFIRKTSLDELPQLINVLRGELSLVGPRPHAMLAKANGQIYDEVVDGYFARHKVKPGITGWAQINGWRGETDTVDKIERRVEHDLHYINNWSVLFDLYILAMTPVSLFNTRNAY